VVKGRCREISRIGGDGMSKYYAVHFCNSIYTPEMLFDKICYILNVKPSWVKHTRKRRAVDAKKCFAKLCLKFFPDVSSVRTGLIANVDHATILYYRRKDEKEIDIIVREINLRI